MTCQLAFVFFALLGASNGLAFVRERDRSIPKRGGFNHGIEHIGIPCGSLRGSRRLVGPYTVSISLFSALACRRMGLLVRVLMENGPCLFNRLVAGLRLCSRRRLGLTSPDLRLLLGVTLCFGLLSELLILLKVDLKAEFLVGRLVAPQTDLENLFI